MSGPTVKGKPDRRTLPLFEIGPPVKTEPEVRRQSAPIWTEHKAMLIERYLYYFVMITKHGAYIDAFAGPQEEVDGTERWSAKLVLESEPRWLQKFYLCDANPTQVARLNKLVEEQPPRRKGDPKRTVEVLHGDANVLIRKVLERRPIKDKEASFALLDQRTFECDWRTVEALSEYKPVGQHKIELFYFLPNHWLDRAIAATKDSQRLATWWGSDDWGSLRGMKPSDRANKVADRLRDLGYASVKPWPIMQREQGGGSVMYYMIHATDHPEAPKLMDRAYRRVLKPKERLEQLTLEHFLSMTEADPETAPEPLDELDELG